MQKVLVVENNRDNLRLIAYALRLSGYDVVTAETGEDGVEMAIRERPRPHPFGKGKDPRPSGAEGADQ